MFLSWVGLWMSYPNLLLAVKLKLESLSSTAGGYAWLIYRCFRILASIWLLTREEVSQAPKSKLLGKTILLLQKLRHLLIWSSLWCRMRCDCRWNSRCEFRCTGWNCLERSVSYQRKKVIQSFQGYFCILNWRYVQKVITPCKSCMKHSDHPDKKSDKDHQQRTPRDRMYRLSFKKRGKRPLLPIWLRSFHMNHHPSEMLKHWCYFLDTPKQCTFLNNALMK
jgi:hypothetical protein